MWQTVNVAFIAHNIAHLARNQLVRNFDSSCAIVIQQINISIVFREFVFNNCTGGIIIIFNALYLLNGVVRKNLVVMAKLLCMAFITEKHTAHEE
jgi:hypothetical protein